MAGPGDYARTVKAIDLETLIVTAGHRRLSAQVCEQARKALAARRGRPVSVSADTWRLVASYLADRYPDG